MGLTSESSFVAHLLFFLVPSFVFAWTPSGSPFLFLFFLGIPAGRNELHLFGRLPGGGTWIGIKCAEIRKTSP